jgi:hypothetical protein
VVFLSLGEFFVAFAVDLLHMSCAIRTPSLQERQYLLVCMHML